MVDSVASASSAEKKQHLKDSTHSRTASSKERRAARTNQWCPKSKATLKRKTALTQNTEQGIIRENQNKGIMYGLLMRKQGKRSEAQETPKAKPKLYKQTPSDK